MDLNTRTWKKSSRSGTNGACVEVSFDSAPDTVLVRDTKDQGNGPVLSFTGQEWTAFVGGVKDDEFSIQ